jgi:2-oxoisovalerate dehydrogenase E1 component alpha subunit
MPKKPSTLDPYRDAFQILRPDGTLTDKDLEPSLSKDELTGHYETMLKLRVLDERMITLQRQGRISFFIGHKGEEAAQVGSAAALQSDDPVLPCYREPGPAFMRGMALREYLAQAVGNAEDPIHGRQMPCHISYAKGHYYSVSSPVGTQIPQAVGAAMAAKIQGDKRVSLVYFGDGATSQGDFHVAANFAGVYKAPVILFCRNNQYAISTSFDLQTASEGIAIKSQAYGIEGVRIDGADFFAVYHTTREAAARARAGEGPTLIEAFMYRAGPHSTSDDPRAYRKDDEVKKWEKLDPLVRFRKYLESKKLWSEERDKRLREDYDQELVATFKELEKLPPPPVETLFEDVYAHQFWHLREQKEELLRYIESAGGRLSGGHGQH